MIDNHKDELDKTKKEYTKLKKALDELRASEVCNVHPVLGSQLILGYHLILLYCFFPQPYPIPFAIKTG